MKGLRVFAHLKNDRLEDLNFLNEYTFLEALDISTVDDHDLSFLSSLKNLRSLSIAVPGKSAIDLSALTDLEELTITWGKRPVNGLDQCQKISRLCLADYFENDFKPIAILRSLKMLDVKTASIDSIEGVSNFDKLESLNLGNCKRLISISHLGSLNQLMSLRFENCPRIHDFDSIANLHSLENLEITNCKKIKSISFLKTLPALKKLSLLGNTDVMDGDMTPAKNLNQVFYSHRAHYNLKIENREIDQLLRENLEKIKKMFK